MVAPANLRLQTSGDTLEFDPATGALMSFRANAAPDQEFIAPQNPPLAFVVQYLDGERRFRQVTSAQAATVGVEVRSAANAGAALVAHYRRLGGLDLDATIVVMAEPGDRYSHWSISLRNGGGLFITDVQFPFVVVRYHLGGQSGLECLVQPFGTGRLIRAPEPHQLMPDHPHNWQFSPENGDASHYPGLTFAQFLAYHNDRAGIFVSTRDTSGRPKLIRPTHRGNGIRLGFGHVIGEVVGEQFELGYESVVTSFDGDWYDAAEVYRDWALAQPWSQQPLHARTDVPRWLLDSPVHVILRLQGHLDAGPAEPNESFLPYPKLIPLLAEFSRKLDSPVAPIIMGWEKHGPWIYPDCFPPVGGFDSMREFVAMARERGWHVGSYCNGTRWVVGHFWSGYDGQEYFREHNGLAGVCREADGRPWRENWDRSWRPSYACCLGAEQTQETAQHFVQTMLDVGLDWVQFLDQNVGCSTFPCYATDHDHPPAPGPWMPARMRGLMESFYAMARDERERSGREIVFSVECPPNEYHLPYFPIYDVRLTPPGHTTGLGDPTCIPLYHFLYHEFATGQGNFAYAPDPYYVEIKSAYTFAMGDIPAVMMGPGGYVIDWEASPWPKGDGPRGDQDGIFELMRNTAAMRRGAARDFLLYGRMLRPAPFGGIVKKTWQRDGRDMAMARVFHSAWQAPDGRVGLVLANWTREPQSLRVRDARLGARASIANSGSPTEERTSGAEELSITVPALGCTLVTGGVSG